MMEALAARSLIVFRQDLINRQGLKMGSSSALASFEKFYTINPSKQWKETCKKESANILTDA
jgi:hypothetical protein